MNVSVVIILTEYTTESHLAKPFIPKPNPKSNRNPITDTHKLINPLSSP